MKLKSTFLFVLTLIASVSFAQTTYTITSDKSWNNNGAQTFPNPCYSCTFDIAAGATLTIEKNVTLQNATFKGGGKVVLANKSMTLWGSSTLKTYFTNINFVLTGSANIIGSAPMILTNSIVKVYETSYINSQWDLDLNNTGMYFYDNSYLLTTGGPVSLRNNSTIVAGDGTLASKAYIKMNGPSVNIYDSGSSIKLAANNNYYFNWSAYNSISNSKSYNTATNSYNCGNGFPNSCQAPLVYGPVMMNYNGMSAIAALPVKLSLFTASSNGKTVVLDWTTAQEMSSKNFVIERTSNGFTWEAIATVDAKGYSNFTTKYSYTDNSPLNGVGYYRLRMVDIDGRTEYSEIKTIRSTVIKGEKIYPNPAADFINISVNANSGNCHVQLISTNGQVVATQTSLQGSNVISMPVSHITTGSYIVKLTYASGETKSFNVLVQHK